MLKSRASLLPPLIPILGALLAWLTPLSFGPVPWPDDSAFYFVAKDFFSWPPRWVMLPQAPFEPTYAIYNFNTMPLYPILIGLGRLVGIDGSFALKIYPLAAWGASGALLVYALSRKGLATWLCALLGLAWASDPAMRWASVLVRPESLIGLFSVAIVLLLTFGEPERLKPRKYFDPIALLLALSAYAHFNAIHLLFPVITALFLRGRFDRILRVGALTFAYLLPWVVTVLARPGLFIQQMTTQWQRLAVGNGWLDSVDKALANIFHEMGNPLPLPSQAKWAAAGFWLLMLAGLAALAYALVRAARCGMKRTPIPESVHAWVPSAAWVLGAMWLWHTKPEVWFTYFFHAATWTFVGIALLRLARGARLALGSTLGAMAALLLAISIGHGSSLAKDGSWNWRTYDEFIGCIDEQLVKLERDLGSPKPFRVWAPTFPDITIELSRRHPDWQLTRTNDFHSRNHLAIRHGHQVQAVVVPETINLASREISAPMSEHPEVESIWMTWKDYYLHQLHEDPAFKPSRRWLCQRGRWVAFIYMKAPGQ